MTKMVAGISKAAVEREAAMMEASSNFIWAKKLRALRAALDKAEAERDQLLKPLETLQAQNFRLSGMVHDLRKEIADTDTLLVREAAASLDRLDRAEKAEAERDSYRKALEHIISDCEADYPPSHGAIKYAAKLALKGESHD